STATQRRYSSSTSGWSQASASTRAMTRRCSVMRMPVAAQPATIPEELSAGVVFKEVIVSRLKDALSATKRMLRQVPAHQKRIQLFATGLKIIAFPTADGRKSGAFIQSAGRLIVFLDLEKD